MLSQHSLLISNSKILGKGHPSLPGSVSRRPLLPYGFCCVRNLLLQHSSAYRVAISSKVTKERVALNENRNIENTWASCKEALDLKICENWGALQGRRNDFQRGEVWSLLSEKSSDKSTATCLLWIELNCYIMRHGACALMRHELREEELLRT